jgi:hypothetical protein
MELGLKEREADDHKQVVVGTVTTEDGEVPLAHAGHRGNTGDVSPVPEALRSPRRSTRVD